MPKMPLFYVALRMSMKMRQYEKDSLKSVHTLVEPLQIAMENGARRALIPLENKHNFLKVSGEIIEKVDPIFYSDLQSACTKALSAV
jgi:ATP-dependent Lon protease